MQNRPKRSFGGLLSTMNASKKSKIFEVVQTRWSAKDMRAKRIAKNYRFGSSFSVSPRPSHEEQFFTFCKLYFICGTLFIKHYEEMKAEVS